MDELTTDQLELELLFIWRSLEPEMCKMLLGAARGLYRMLPPAQDGTNTLGKIDAHTVH